MSTKKLITAVLLLLGALVPQSATAAWYHEGSALEAGENVSLELTGPIAFSSPNGGIACPSGTITVEATGGTNLGHLLAFKAEDTKACEVSGALVFVTGGTTTVKDSELTKIPNGTNAGSDIQVVDIVFHVLFTNGFKLTLSTLECEVEGTKVITPITVTPNNPKAMTGGTATGPLRNSLGGEVVVNASGNILGEASGTYGIQP